MGSRAGSRVGSRVGSTRVAVWVGRRVSRACSTSSPSYGNEAVNTSKSVTEKEYTARVGERVGSG